MPAATPPAPKLPSWRVVGARRFAYDFPLPALREAFSFLNSASLSLIVRVLYFYSVNAIPIEYGRRRSCDDHDSETYIESIAHRKGQTA